MVGLIHQTDLFHPHGDPDDHFDLATLYALAQQNLLQIKLLVGDYPPPHRAGDPAIQAATQLDYLSSTNTSFCIGTPHTMQNPTDLQRYAKHYEHNAVRRIAQALREAEAPIYITVVGGATDIALAGLKYPALFSEKCRGILLNSGSGIPYDGDEPAAEYNVKLNAAAYAALFTMPCPLYWFPCYHMVKPNWVELPGEYGTVYGFSQNAVLPLLHPNLQNYFLYMLEKSADPKYLRYLFKEPDQTLLKKHGSNPRRMWSTASFLFLCGLHVTRGGSIVPLEDSSDLLYRMEPVRIQCDAQGQTSWAFLPKPPGDQPPRFLFHVLDTNAYEGAMTKALVHLLSSFTPSV